MTTVTLILAADAHAYSSAVDATRQEREKSVQKKGNLEKKMVVVSMF